MVAFSGGNGEASAAESCQGLDTALQNNLNFIAQQQANPDTQSAARIENREAVVDQIQQRRQVAGCNGELVAQPIDTGSGESCAGLDQALLNNLNFIDGQRANPDSQSAARIENRQAVVDLIQQRRQAAGCTEDVQAGGRPPAEAPAQEPPAEAPAEQPPAEAPAEEPQAEGEVVCAGSTVTLSGEAGAPAASSNQFPVGTKLRVTNLDNDKSVTVEVTGASGSCALLNDAAFEQVREPGKNLIRRAVIERVG
nr:septal ring lytic transglycosylase RlpA family protein [Actinophytocola oryzae]